MAINQHGLSRDIPEGVKRQIRQRDGFGCVVCGRAIYDYEHIAPEFSDAREHSSQGILLLCSEHHSLKTRGLLSKETILAAAQNPRAKQHGFSFGPFDIGAAPPTIRLGTLTVRNVQTLIEILGEPIFSIRPPNESGLPFLINACLRDRDGEIILHIVDNEWRTPCENWDVEIEGPRITIRKKLGDILLQLRSEPPHQLVIERLDMIHRGNRVTCREGVKVEVESDSGARFVAMDTSVEGSEVALDFDGFGIGIGRGGGTIHIGVITGIGTNASPRVPIRTSMFAIPRNTPCPCGSGRKHKHCHGRFQR